ncbi:MAG TPA: STAS domain-containing protein [Candidatus Angelobacter sp.]|jgi:anti-sigma B factor antagonist
MKPQPDALYLFLCHLECRKGQNPNAYKELVAALDDQNADIRQAAESLLHLAAASTDTLKINIVENKDGALVCLSGNVDIDSSPALRNQLLALLRSRNNRMVSVDLFAVTKIDSSGFATLIEALKIARAGKTQLKLQGLHDGLLRMVELTGLLSLFNGNSKTITRSGLEVV